MPHPLRLAPWCLALLVGPLLASPTTNDTSARLPMTDPADALRAADPNTPSAMVPLAMPAPQRLDTPELPADLAQARAIWRELNQQVAQFPRGHIDLLRWEARQPGGQPQDAAASVGEPLSPAEALRVSLQQRPDLFIRPGLSPIEQARVRAAYAAHVRDLQGAWIDAVATHAGARASAAALDAVRTGVELGRRMVRAGNWSQARLAQEQRSEATAWRAQSDAALSAQVALERLAGLMGIWRADAVQALGQQLPTSLPAPPPSLSGSGSPERDVLQADTVLPIEQAESKRVFDSLPTGRWQAWREARDAALKAMPEPGNARPEPPRVDDPRMLREAQPLEADEHRARLLRMASERRAAARLAWAQLTVRHAQALHADAVLVQLGEARQQESLLRYNGMLESTWQLLASARERGAALDAATQARRGYWRAQAAWQALLGGADFALDAAQSAAGDSAGNSPH
ncbi:MAG: hypothetical protein KF871_11105 [Hydrogenophaga sp.]|uniref:hypothetical protein n=1 Tax=Hydrogenophaga sp. TaxID=1904254 RepID=UPI001D978F6D|nr:hypothetical protein [Hydrogenophaga sp.]MBX3610431.1 hypothetical protein [Hydrogenophaga sp.]